VNDSAGLFIGQLSARQDDVRTSMQSAAIPAGAAGPTEYKPNNISVWYKGFTSSSTKDTTDDYYGYDVDTSGYVFGADFLFDTHARIGIAAGSASSSVEKESGATGDADSTYAALYASAENGEWLFNASLMYGNSAIEQDLGETFDTTADYDAVNIAGRIGVRRQLVSDYFIFTPEVALVANMYNQDAYTESSTNSYVREVEGYSELYLQSSVGATLGMYMALGDAVFRPEISLYWLHQFNADDIELNATLEDSTDPITITLQGQEENIIRFGTGVAFNPSEALEIRTDVSVSTGDGYSAYDLSAQIRYSF
jgi:outer membrane autotransporter protein